MSLTETSLFFLSRLKDMVSWGWMGWIWANGSK